MEHHYRSLDLVINTCKTCAVINHQIKVYELKSVDQTKFILAVSTWADKFTLTLIQGVGIQILGKFVQTSNELDCH